MIGVIDIETSGFFKDGGKIVEVGIVGLDFEKRKVYKLFSSVCREEGMTGKDHKAWIFQNSDLTVEAVRESPLFSEITGDVQAAINRCTGVTAYNKVFDMEFLKDRGIIIENELDCPMLIAKDVLKIKSTKSWSKDYKWPSVEECWAYFFPNVPYDEAHRGLDDAKHEALIVLKLHDLGLM